LNKFHRIIVAILTIIALPLVILVGTVSFLWGAWWLGVALIVAGYGIGKRKARLIGMAFVVCIVSIPITLNQISARMDTYGTLIRSQGPEALSTSQRVSIYLGNIAMAVGGIAIVAPEVAFETVFLIKPNHKKSYSIEGYDFAMKSPYIRGLVQDYATNVASGDAPMRLDRTPLRWTANMPYGFKDYRVALAVAGGGLRAVAQKTDDGYRIDCNITIDVRYSEGYKLKIIDAYGVRFIIDEAIFSALQDLGWLHPYILRYHWTVTADQTGKVIVDEKP
jgi:hypothetical protein